MDCLSDAQLIVCALIIMTIFYLFTPIFVYLDKAILFHPDIKKQQTSQRYDVEDTIFE